MGRCASLLLMLSLVLGMGPVAGEESAMEAFSTRHFRIHLLSEQREEGTEVAADLEAFRSQYKSLMGSLVPLHEQQRRLEVFTFDGPAGLKAVLADYPQLVRGTGVFPGEAQARAPGMVAVDATGLLGRSDLASLFHGVVHLCHDALFYDPDVSGSWWVREGVAMYLMQTPYAEDGTFNIGKVRTSEGYIADTSKSGRVSGTIPFAGEPKKSLSTAAQAFEKGRHLPLADLLDHDAAKAWPDQDQRDLAAIQSWVLVHFLLHGPEVELRSRMARFLALERQGKGGADAFRKVVSGDLDRLEPLVYRHIKKMR
jgi:hypothetical protein